MRREVQLLFSIESMTVALGDRLFIAEKAELDFFCLFAIIEEAPHIGTERMAKWPRKKGRNAGTEQW